MLQLQLVQTQHHVDPQSFPDGLHPPTHPPTHPLKHLCPNHPLSSHRPLLQSIYPYSVHPSIYTLSIYLSIHCPSIYPIQCSSTYAIHFPFIYSHTVHPFIHILSIDLPIHCSSIYPSSSLCHTLFFHLSNPLFTYPLTLPSPHPLPHPSLYSYIPLLLRHHHPSIHPFMYSLHTYPFVNPSFIQHHPSFCLSHFAQCQSLSPSPIILLCSHLSTRLSTKASAHPPHNPSINPLTCQSIHLCTK